MEKPTSYCDAVLRMEPGSVHRLYHDYEYGYPVVDDDRLFERLMLEINQAGLSWTTILNKKQHFFEAFEGFDIAKVAAYGEEQVDRLLQDKGIIRNRLKIAAAITNANSILHLQQEHGSFSKWLAINHPKSKLEWVKIFKQTFRFTGGEIVGEFLMSIGYLPGAHVPDCPVYKKLLSKRPPWSRNQPPSGVAE